MLNLLQLMPTNGALLDIVGQIQNPLNDASTAAGPAFGRLGEIVGALNSQLYAGANTVSAMVDGYKELEVTNPDAPLVKAMTTFEDIFSMDSDTGATAVGQSIGTTLAPTQNFDPVTSFMGDGKEVINLNELLGSATGSSGLLGGGIMSGILSQNGTQTLMSTGTNALFGLMQQLQTSMGPESEGNGLLLPGAVSAVKSGIGNIVSNATGQSNVSAIEPVLPLEQETLTNAQISNQSLIATAYPSSYPTTSSSQANNTTTALGSNMAANVVSGLASTLTGATGSGTIFNSIPATGVLGLAQSIQSRDTSALADTVTGMISSAGNVVGRINSTTSTDVDTNTGVITNTPTPQPATQASASNTSVMFTGQNAVSTKMPSLETIDGFMDDMVASVSGQSTSNSILNNDGVWGNATLHALQGDEPTTPPTIYQLPDLPSIETDTNKVNTATSIEGQTTETNDHLVKAFNEKLLGDKASDVEALPVWMQSLNATRRLQEEELEPCYLVDRNLVGRQVTNLRAWNLTNCQSLCAETDGCKFWTFAPQIALCYMYDVVTGTTYTKNTVSGPVVCPEATDATVPTGLPTANDFLFGLTAPVQNILGGDTASENGLGPLQRIMTGADGENIISSIVETQASGGSTYQMLGSQFADGFESGGTQIIESLPNVAAGIFGDTTEFQAAANSAVSSADRLLATSNDANGFLAKKQTTESSDALSGMAVTTTGSSSAQIRYPSSTQSSTSALYGMQNRTAQSPSAHPVTTVSYSSIAPSTAVQNGSLVQQATGQELSGQAASPDIFATTSSIAQAGTKLMDTLPMMDIAKAAFQLYNSGFFRNKGLFGGNSTGDKMASLPAANLGVPRVTCNWRGMQCCVPKDSVPKKNQDDPISLNGVDATQCQAVDYFEADVDELCVTIKFDDSSTSCNTTKFKIGSQLIYQATMEMPAKMNNGLCECILNEDEGTIDSNASWQVNMINLQESQEKAEQAEVSAEKIRQSASTAMAWTQMIANTAQNIGAAAFNQDTSAVANTAAVNEYDPQEMGEGTKWSDALTSLTNVRNTVNQAKNTVAGYNV